MAPQYHRWLRFMLKELTAGEIASTEELDHVIGKAVSIQVAAAAQGPGRIAGDPSGADDPDPFALQIARFLNFRPDDQHVSQAAA